MKHKTSNSNEFAPIFLSRQSLIKKNLIKRSQIIHAIRKFFFNNSFIEVETPNRIPTPAPEAFIDAIESSTWFLHTSPELCMKRILASGYNRIFQICKCYRSGERGNEHLPEFTILEWYHKGYDYFKIMEECEDMILSVLDELKIGTKINYQGYVIDLIKPWERLSVKEAFFRYSARSLEKVLEKDEFDIIMVNEIEPGINRNKPVFLYDYPETRSALSKLKDSDRSVAERFELYIGGIELANAFSELTDPVLQLSRFNKENECRKLFGKQMYKIPEKFIESLSYMPESAGIALGIDRLIMILCNTKDIDDIVTFVPEEL